MGAWVVMLLLGSLLWVAGGYRLTESGTPTPTPAPTPLPSPSPAAAPSPSPTPRPPSGSAHPDEFVGRWAELAETDVILVVLADGDNLRIVSPQADAGLFQPSGPGFEQVLGDTINRLELDEDGNLLLITTQLGSEGQRRTARVFTPEPEGDMPADPKQELP